MDLNINKIIQDKILELEENHVIENAIQKKIESVIKDAVDSAFNWEFSRAISDEIKKQVGNIAESVKLNSYNTLIADTVKNITEAEMNKDLAEKVQTKIKELMLVTEKSVKFSDIIKTFKKVTFDDDTRYEYNVSEDERETSYGFKYKKFLFIPEDDGEKLEIELMKYQENPWELYKVRYNDEMKYSRESISTLKHYDQFECLILRCFLNNLEIELDMNADSCMDELYQSDCNED